eukprot:m.417013 g.417013  ORF g.417013 m.417013 type:complete len:117 (-) comp16830_c2_seq3:160-510(-)
MSFRVLHSRFGDCERMCVSSSHLREAPRDVFNDCPLAQLEADTDKNRRLVLRLQYWSTSTHRMCSEPRREWVVMMMLVVQRLRSRDSQESGPVLPIEMWLMILGFVPRWALGVRVC